VRRPVPTPGNKRSLLSTGSDFTGYSVTVIYNGDANNKVSNPSFLGFVVTL